VNVNSSFARALHRRRKEDQVPFYCRRGRGIRGEKHADEQIARIAPTKNVLFGFAPSRNVSSWQMFGSTKRTYALATSCQEHGFAAVSSAAAVVSNATIH
jgi:hypothetical protein